MSLLPESPPPARRIWWAGVVAILFIGFLAFRPGLSGPMLLDDQPNLSPLAEFADGQRSAANVVFGNVSGMLGRPLSMASFVANVAVFGYDAHALKAVNLALHLLTGAIVALLLRRLLGRDAKLARHANRLSLLLGAIWLLHPLQVSTVLYIVQRMALLAALFTFAALLAYMAGRERIERGQRGGGILLFVIFPLLVLLGLACKENAVLAPLLAGVLECTLFAPEAPSDRANPALPGKRRPMAARVWLSAFVAFPIAFGVALLVWKHGRFLNYSGRDFDLYQRLLSEMRILWDYVGAWLLPFGPRMGLYHDNYPLSTGPLSPPSTLFALLGWAGVLIAAFALRRRAPLFSAGVLFYLCGHLLESTILPLELYFEHRNYLPGLGVLLAVAGLVELAWSHLHEPTPAFRRIGTAALVALPLAYGFATWARSTIWGEESLFWAQQQRYNPSSGRMRAELVSAAIAQGDLPLALHQIDLMEPYNSPRDRMQPPLLRVLAYCAANRPVPATVFGQVQAAAHGGISLYDRIAWREIATRVEAGGCPAVDANPLINIGRDWLAQAPGATWQARFYLALMLASQSRFAEAEAEARRAWVDGGHDPHIGIFLYQINGTLENRQACREILAELEQHAGKGDFYVDRAVREFREAK